MKQSILAIKNEFRVALRTTLDLFLPYFASCSLFMSLLLAVAAFIMFGIGGIWSVMGHGNDPAWWGLKTITFAAVSFCSYLGCLFLMSKPNNDKYRS